MLELVRSRVAGGAGQPDKPAMIDGASGRVLTYGELEAAIRSLAGGAGLPRLDTSRLRAAWLADVADLLGLATFMHAAGITCSQRLGDLLAGLEPAAEADAVRLLGAARPS